MIHTGAASSIAFVGKFLRDSGYDLRHLGYDLDLGDGLYANYENLEPLLARTTRLPLSWRACFLCRGRSKTAAAAQSCHRHSCRPRLSAVC